MTREEQHHQVTNTFYDLALEDRGVYWMAKSPNGHGVVGGTAKQVDQLWRAARQQSGWDFYVCTGSPRKPRNRKPGRADIAGSRVLAVDIDPPPGQPRVDVAQLNPFINAGLGAVHNTLVDSGRGAWVWIHLTSAQWFTDEAIQRRYERVLKGLYAWLAQTLRPELGRVDMSCAESSRLMRCPGTQNQKTGRWSVFHSWTPVSMQWARLEERFLPFAPEEPEPAAPLGPIADNEQAVVNAMTVTGRQFVMLGTDTERHRGLFVAAASLRDIGAPREMAQRLLERGASRCRPSLLLTDPRSVSRVITQLYGSLMQPSAAAGIQSSNQGGSPEEDDISF